MKSIILFIVLLGLLSCKSQPLKRINDNHTNNITVKPQLGAVKKEPVLNLSMPPIKQTKDTLIKSAGHQKEAEKERIPTASTSKTKSTLLTNGTYTPDNNTISTNDTEPRPTAIGTRLSATVLKILATKSLTMD